MSSSEELLDVLLVGYGAVGIIYTYILENSKRVRATVVARGNFAQLNTAGANIHSEKFGNHQGWKPYRTLSSVAEAADRPYAYIVDAAKALPDIMSTPVLLAPLLSPAYAAKYPQPVFVLLQNGLGVEEDLYQAAKLSNKDAIVLSAAVYIDTNLTEQRHVVRHTGSERLRIGVYTGTGRDSSLTPSLKASISLQTFMELIKAGGSDIVASENIQHDKFRKNCWNAAVNSCCALTRLPCPALSATPHVESVMRSTLRGLLLEMVAIGQALGYPVDATFAEETAEDTVTGEENKTTVLKPSTLVDVERGSPIEVEVIVGALVIYGKEHGIAMPRLEMIYALLSVIQAQAIAKAQSVFDVKV